LLLSTLSSSFH